MGNYALSGTAHQRGYGSRWQKARIPFLAANPLCVMCQAKGIVTAARIVDHITPHKGDQDLFWDQSNWQALCKPCHDLKTITEDGGLDSGAMTHPEWLPLPACRVVLVTGPAGAGKTTYCREQAKAQDIIIDLDDCFEAVCGVHGHDADRKYLKQAIRYRNKLMASLTTKTSGTAYVIVSAPSEAEVAWWAHKLNADHVRIDPGQATVKERIAGRRWQAALDWYAKAKANDWAPPSGIKPRQIGADGWPIQT